MDDLDEFLMDSDEQEEDEDSEEEALVIEKMKMNSGESDFDPIGFGIEQRMREAQPLDDSEDGDDDEDLEDELEDNMAVVVGAYMADDFKDLHVGSEIEELFRYIEDYKPMHLDLEESI